MAMLWGGGPPHSMVWIPKRLPATTLWGSSQAGSTLLFASSAWMVSGLSSSPLLNGALPAVAAVPLLLRQHRQINGYVLRIVGAILLIVISLIPSGIDSIKSVLIAGTFLALFLHNFGKELSSVPIKQNLVEQSGTNMQSLRIVEDLGAVSGNLITALIFPAIRQFIPASLLLMPLTLGLPETRNFKAAKQRHHESLPVHNLCLLQGLVIGALFALLALWVREIDGGKCFDFAMVLTAYQFGRPFMLWIPKMAAPLRYLMLLALILSSQMVTQAWLSVALFIPIGALVSSCERTLIDDMSQDSAPTQSWQVLHRSSAIGGIIGSISLGVLCQFAGLDTALWVIGFGFLMLASLHALKPATT